MHNNLKKIFGMGSLFLFFAVIAGYAYYRSQALVKGVILEVSGIEDGALYKTSRIDISGVAKNAKYLSINNREITIDDSSKFNDTILLAKGYNIVTVKAEDKFGNKKEKDYQLVYK